MCQATKQDFDRDVKGEAFDMLTNVGAVAIGTNNSVLGEHGITQLDLCVVKSKLNIMHPPVTFLISRILPVLNEVFDL